MGVKLQPGTGGNIYVPYEERAGNESIVYFTRDLSAQGFARAYEQVNGNIHGKVGLKLHTGEQHGPNILPRDWVKSLREKEPELQDSHIIETNAYYEGDRYTTEQHRKTLELTLPMAKARGFSLQRDAPNRLYEPVPALVFP